jgi:hypothetical protein
MKQLHAHNRWARTTAFVLAALLLLALLLMAGARQVSLPLTGIQSNRQFMPPDPEDWCRKVNLKKLDSEMAKAELYFSENVGGRLVDWLYLRRALRHTGVQVNGPEDVYWLEIIRGSGCAVEVSQWAAKQTELAAKQARCSCKKVSA